MSRLSLTSRVSERTCRWVFHWDPALAFGAHLSSPSQDHPGVVVVYELNDNYTSLDGLAGDRLNAALGAFAKGDGILTQELSLLAYLSPWQYLSPSELIKATKLALTPNSALPARHQAIQVASIGAGTPTMEILPINVYFAENPAGDKNVSYISLAACLQQSLSRGTIVSFPASRASRLLALPAPRATGFSRFPSRVSLDC